MTSTRGGHVCDSVKHTSVHILCTHSITDLSRTKLHTVQYGNLVLSFQSAGGASIHTTMSDKEPSLSLLISPTLKARGATPFFKGFS